MSRDSVDNNKQPYVVDEVNEVFSDFRTQEDLKTIKRIRKVLGESNQIVINRELEVKEVVRALQQRVETAEEAAADESLLTECKSNIQEAEDDKDSLTDQIASVKAKTEEAKRQLEQQRLEKERLKGEQTDMDKDMSIEIPRNKGLLALYQNITNVRWDASADNIKGFVIPDESDERCEPRVIDIQEGEMSDFEIANAVWDIID